jgi:hypothetical protein
MRRLLLAVPFLLACARAETPPADSAAAAPAALTEADVAGTWSGTLMPEGSDSVLGNWTAQIGGGTYRLTTAQTPNDTVTGTYTLEGDSSRFSAGPHADPAFGGAMVIDEGTSRFSGNQITVTGVTRLAAKPDSILLRFRGVGTRNP